MFLIPACVLKTFELALAVTCLVLHQLCYDLTQLTTLMLCSGTFFGFIIVLTGEIIGEVVGPIEVVQDMLYSMIGGTFYAVCGVAHLLFHHLHSAAVYVLCILCFISSALMFIDAWLAILESKEQNDDETREAVGPIQVVQDMLFSVVGAALFAYCGVVQLLFHDHLCVCVFAMVIFCIAMAVLMLADLCLACFEPGESSEDQTPYCK